MQIKSEIEEWNNTDPTARERTLLLSLISVIGAK